MPELKNNKEKKEKSKKHLIMLVDDDEGNLESLGSRLEKIYNVRYAHNGFEALGIIKSMLHPEEIKLIISDQRMPVMTGIQLFESLKDMIPFTIRIIHTAYEDLNGVIPSINNAKVHEYILKSTEPKELLLRVERAIEFSETQRSIALKDVLLSMFAHSVGDQMTILSGKIQTLYRNSSSINDEKIKEYISRINIKNDYISNLMKDFFNWGLSQKGIIESHPDEINIKELADKVITFFKDEAQSKNINLFSEINETAIAFADKGMLLLVLRCLISNAMKARSKEIGLKVAPISEHGFIGISVHDNRVGVNQEDIAKRDCEDIFNVDYRNGNGHELNICKELVRMNCGSLSIENKPGKGSCATITLPVPD